MPFARHGGFTFSFVSVLQNAPACSGVYGLSNGREWVFIGASDNVQAALLAHVRDLEEAFRSRGVAGFTCEPCQPEFRNERHNRLLAELSPVCNPHP